MKINYFRQIPIAIFSLFGSICWSQDSCSAAIGLSVNPTSVCSATTSGTTVGATQSQPGCLGAADDDVWYSFTATSAIHVVTVTPGTLSDAVLEVFSGSCGSLVSLGCADVTVGSSPETLSLSTLTAGNTYYVRVYSWASGVQGTFSLCVTTLSPPANNECPGATTLTSAATCTPIAGSTSGASQSAPAQTCNGFTGNADDDVWYAFTATTAAHTITVAGGSTFDAVVELRSGACNGTVINCADATFTAGTETINATGLSIGSQYYIRVYSYGTTSGTFNICLTSFTATSNDNCNVAGTVTVNPASSCATTVSGTTSGATQSQPGCLGTADDDVWYSFTATSAGHVVTVTPGTLSDAVLQVFSGSCGSLASLGCADATLGSSAESLTLSGLTSGLVYFIRIYSYSSGAGQGTFSLCVTTVTPPVPCTNGPGTGITELGCPSVISGGLGLNGADPAPIDCQSGSCVDLEATYLQLGQTTDYTVESIVYAPPYQFDCLDNPVSVNVDDIWSPLITLPFNFCFYGNTYNQCLISSNGVITFDTAANAPGGYSTWSFANNLPSTALFMNSIFGVYHDIDPSISGEVGWELITLNTGCRALVAAWNEIPMFSSTCNSLLYTGMIVLYENTNVIEVYIQEKNVCGSWNAGNAIVGLQNSGATMSAVAPNRNGLDADWTVTNEAWRFVPSGATITSLAWYEGLTATGPVIGTGDVLNVCPSTTTSYTAQVTYTLCNGATLVETESTTVTVDLNKVWNGSQSSDWNTAANWTPPGVPTAMDCVVIPPAPNVAIISGASYDAFAYSLAVLNNGVLASQSSNNLTVTNAVNVQPGGNFSLANSSSLIQINNSVNSGVITMERITPPVYRFDYTYWNSPVTQGSGYTLGMLSPGTQYDKYYSWNPSVSGGMGIWAQESAASVMNPAKGYIVRAPNSFSFTPDVTAPYTAVFTGTPNNGNINCPIAFGSLGPAETTDKWNLIGNPYPSAVSSSAFVSHAANTSVIDGTLYFWTHNSPISAAFPDPFYGDYVLNYSDADYASWNLLGATSAISGGSPPQDFIAAGQSFFTRSLAVPGNAVFTNGMRVSDNNQDFFRNDAAKTVSEIQEKHRIWLDLRSDEGAFSQILIGYAPGATLEYDRGLDGLQMNETGVDFYSLIGNTPLVIQGRPVPFDVQDQVPMGLNAPNGGNFSLRINSFDTMFENVGIYVEDLLLGIVHDLKLAPYFFNVQPGATNDRFVLRYTAEALTVQQDASGAVGAYINNGLMYVQAYTDIESISVFDITGKLIRKHLCDSRSFSTEFIVSKGVYPIIVKLKDGTRAIRKLMN